MEQTARNIERQSSSTPWKLLFHKARAITTLLGVLVIALVLEVWLRIWILPIYKASRGSYVDGFNGIIRAWGVSTWWVTRVCLGLKVKVEGNVPDSGRYVLITNHQSSTDIPALMSVLRRLNLKFVAKEELKYGKPAVSAALRNGGFAFVAKRNRDEDLKRLREFGRDVKRFHGSPAIFPEGIRTFDGDLRSLRWAGTKEVLESSRLPILPATIDGLWKARTIKELHLLVGSRVTFRVGEPIPFETYLNDPDRVLQSVEESIRTDLVAIRQQA